MLEWDNILANAFISFIVAVGVGLYIRYKVKPKHEEVFDHNRNDAIKTIFSFIQQSDSDFVRLIDTIETEMGPITKKRDTVTPKPTIEKLPDGGQSMKFTYEETQKQLKYEKIKPKLEFDFKRIEYTFNLFQQNYQKLHNHIEKEFLEDVWKYLHGTYHYSEWALKDHLGNYIFKDQITLSKKIIKFLEKDKNVDRTYPSIKEFIEKWKNIEQI